MFVPRIQRKGYFRKVYNPKIPQVQVQGIQSFEYSLKIGEAVEYFTLQLFYDKIPLNLT